MLIIINYDQSFNLIFFEEGEEHRVEVALELVDFVVEDGLGNHRFNLLDLQILPVFLNHQSN